AQPIHQWLFLPAVDLDHGAVDEEGEIFESGLSCQSALTPANFTTLPHFSVSLAISLPKSTGEPGSAVAPHWASRAFILGSTRAALISVLSLSTISAGVLGGAPMPVQKLNS